MGSPFSSRIIGHQPRRTKGAEAAVSNVEKLPGVSVSEAAQFAAVMGLAHTASHRGGRDGEQGRGHSHSAVQTRLKTNVSHVPVQTLECAGRERETRAKSHGVRRVLCAESHRSLEIDTLQVKSGRKGVLHTALSSESHPDV